MAQGIIPSGPMTRRAMTSLAQMQRVNKVNRENSVQAPSSGSLMGGPMGKSYVPPLPDPMGVGFPAVIVAGPGSLPPGSYYATPQYATLDIRSSSLAGTTTPVFSFKSAQPTTYGSVPIIVNNLAEFQSPPGGPTTDPSDPTDDGLLQVNQVVWVQKLFGTITTSLGTTGGVIYITNGSPGGNITKLCTLTWVGGSDGSGSGGLANIQSSWTYTATDPATSKVYCTAQPLRYNRFAGAQVQKATKGEVTFDGSVWEITDADEWQVMNTTCTP